MIYSLKKILFIYRDLALSLLQVCSTMVRLGPGELKYYKGCSDLSTCESNRLSTQQHCQSGDVVFQVSTHSGSRLLFPISNYWYMLCVKLFL